MKGWFSLLVVVGIVAIFCTAGKPGGGGGGATTPWFQTQWTSSGAWVPVNAPASSGNIGKFTFPTYTYRSSGRLVTSFLTTTTDSNVLGNLFGKTITATFAVAATAGADFSWGGALNRNGDGPGWNVGCGRPAHCRIMFSTRATTYSNTQSDTYVNDYWWQLDPYVEISESTGTVTITISLNDLSLWQGGDYNNPGTRQAAFDNACRNVRQIGIAFGGGCFYDVGVGVLEGTGTATFSLISFTVQ